MPKRTAKGKGGKGNKAKPIEEVLEAPVPMQTETTTTTTTTTTTLESAPMETAPTTTTTIESALPTSSSTTTTTTTTATIATTTTTTTTTGTTEEAVQMETTAVLDRTQSQIAKQEELMSSLASAKSRDIELVFAFDTTGSMFKYLEEVRSKLRESIEKLMKDIPGIRIGIMAVGDYDTVYTVDVFDLSREVNKIINFVNGVQNIGGGDYPEAYELVLRKARNVSWSKSDIVNKALVFVGDAIPHPPSFTDQALYWREEVDELAKLGVKIYGVQAGENYKSKLFFEQIASASGGVFLTLKKLPLITDMFLAVCYREFGTQHLETYKQEVVAEGRMNEDMNGMFSQLERLNSNLSEHNVDRKLCVESWYHRDYDINGARKYYYNVANDKFQTSPVKAAASTSAGKGKKRKAVEEAEKVKEETKVVEKTEKELSPKKGKGKEKEKKEAKKSAPKKSAKKSAPKKAKKEESEEEEIKPIKKNESIILGTGEWKKDRLGRLVKLP